MKSLLKNLKPYVPTLLGSMVFMLIVRMFQLLNPLIVKYAVDTVLGSKPYSGPEIIDRFLKNSLNNTLIAMLIIAVLYSMLTFFGKYLMAKSAESMAFDLRTKYFAHIQNFSFETLSKWSSGDFIQRSISDIDMLRNFTSTQLSSIVDVFFLLIFSFFMMLGLNVPLTIAVWSLSPLIFLNSAMMYRKLKVSQKELEEEDARMTTKAQEAIQGVRVVRAFGREAYEVNAFDESNSKLSEHIMTVNAIQSKSWSINGLLSRVQRMIVFVMGSFLLVDGKLSLGDLIAFYGYVSIISEPQMIVMRTISSMAKVGVSAARIDEVFDEPEEDTSGENLRPKILGNLEFKNVSFAYPDGGAKTLNGISFKLPAGKTLGILGATGSGKSSLLYLLQRLYDYDGEIYLDGIELRRIEKEHLRKHVGIIMQEPFLFSGTIGENIGVSKLNYGSDLIEDAARMSSIHEHIMGFREAYDTVVGEKGVSLSGGEKQRISIARTLIDPDKRVIAFDDSLSALDTQTDLSVRENLAKEKWGRSRIIVSHRLSSVSECSQILFLSEGKIIESGTHEELMDLGGEYFGLWKYQNIDMSLDI